MSLAVTLLLVTQPFRVGDQIVASNHEGFILVAEAVRHISGSKPPGADGE
jgi:hypothetical protein